MKYVLRLLEDIVPSYADISYLPAAARAVYTVEGGLTVETPDSNQFVRANTCWVGEGEICYVAGTEDSRVLRWELVSTDLAHDGCLRSSPKSQSRQLSQFEIDLDSSMSWLMRCDQVTFQPGTVAPVHMHQGPGLRYVVVGEIDAIGPGGVAKLHKPGDSFIENGIDEPVYAVMHKEEVTSFLRGLLLPRAVIGRPSTRIVNKEDWDRPRSQTYHVHAEKFIELP